MNDDEWDMFLYRCGNFEIFRKGQTIYEAGQPCKKLFWIMSGKKNKHE